MRAKTTTIRTFLTWSLSVLGAIAGLSAVGDAHLTYATDDYRPILIRGVWYCAFAFLAFHGTALAARGWKGRIAGVIASLLVLFVLSELLGRLTALSR